MEKRIEDSFKCVDLEWTDSRGRPARGRPVNTRVYFVVEREAPLMRGRMNLFLRALKAKSRMKRTHDGNCVAFRRDGRTTYILAAYGETLSKRVALVAHEALHMAEDFWKHRPLPSGTKLNREEHKCRLLEVVVSEYVRLHEEGSRT